MVQLLLMLKKLGVRKIHAHFFHMLIILSFLLLLIFLVALPEGSILVTV